MQPVGELLRRQWVLWRHKQSQRAVFGDTVENAGGTQLALEYSGCVPRRQTRRVLGGWPRAIEMEVESAIEASIEMDVAPVLAQHIAQTLYGSKKIPDTFF